MKVLITGANGFIGKNMVTHFSAHENVEIIKFNHNDPETKLRELLSEASFVFHFAGVNRPENIEEFKVGNTDLTSILCKSIISSGKCIPVVFISSIQAEKKNPYGESKREAEKVLLEFSRMHNTPVYIFRLPNVFGKWARPNYNSVVATFCHNISRDLPIEINDPSAQIPLVYIDDVIAQFVSILDREITTDPYCSVQPEYGITVGELAEMIYTFRNSRNTLLSEPVGTGLTRALYSTYISYLPPEYFSYNIPNYTDPRGQFVEIIKTHNSGQFSYFTAHPGVTRGGHYHHTKTEKFLVIKGKARFRFRNIVTNDFHELTTSGDVHEVVETAPGWAHDITNIGDEEMIVFLWANEILDRERPDTYSYKV